MILGPILFIVVGVLKPRPSGSDHWNLWASGACVFGLVVEAIIRVLL